MIRHRFFFGMSAFLVFVLVTMTVTAAPLNAREIIKRSQAAYAALTSYSDDGTATASIGSSLVAPHSFTIRLARPNLYRIDWQQGSGIAKQKGTVWSAGNGDFMSMSGMSPPEKFSSRELALAGATGVSGGAAGSIPGIFFNQQWGNVLSASLAQSPKVKSDEKVGETDCYVVTCDTGSGTRTLWIGKEDFLIRETEEDVKAAALKAKMEAAAKEHPELQIPRSLPGDTKLVQLHENISINKTFSAQDFDH